MRRLLLALMIAILLAGAALGQETAIYEKNGEDVGSLIKDLGDANSTIRSGAAFNLGDLGDSRAVDPLILVLKDENEDVRWAAARSLGELKDQRAVDPLIMALNDEDDLVRASAAEALGQLNDTRAVDPLILALGDVFEDVRKLAARSLGDLGDPRAVDGLIPVLKDVDDSTRSDAAEALGLLNDTRAVGPLIQSLGDEDEGVRSKAAEALGKIRDPRAAEPLIQAFKDSDGSVRIEAQLALINLNAVDPLIQALNDGNTNVRSNSASALDVLSDTRAVGPLIKALNDENADVRRSAALSLGTFNDTRAVSPLAQALKDGDQYVRSCAARSLGELKDARAVDPLIQALKDDKANANAAWALGVLGDARAVDPLIQALNYEDEDVRSYAAEALNKLGDRNPPCFFEGPLEPHLGHPMAGPALEPGDYVIWYSEYIKSSDPAECRPSMWQRTGQVTLTGGKLYILAINGTDEPRLEEKDPFTYLGESVSKSSAVLWVDNLRDSPYVYCVQPAGLVLSKKASDTDVWARVGSKIYYTYILQNNCNTTLHNLSLSDSILGRISLDKTALEPGESAVGYKVYALEAADLPASNSSRVLVNTATARAVDLNGALYEAYDDASVNIINRTTPDCIQIEVHPSKDKARIGDNIVFSYIVANNCDITLYDIAVTGNIRDGLADIGLSKTTLRPYEKAEGSYSINVEDSDLPGPMASLATVTAYDIDGNPHTNRTKASVKVESQKPSIETVRKYSSDRTLLWEVEGYRVDDKKFKILERDEDKDYQNSFLAYSLRRVGFLTPVSIIDEGHQVVPHGKFRSWTKGGGEVYETLVAEGEYSNGLKQGRWDYWHQGSLVGIAPKKGAEGEFVDGLQEGHWIYYSVECRDKVSRECDYVKGVEQKSSCKRYEYVMDNGKCVPGKVRHDVDKLFE